MAQTAAHLVEQVISWVPTRQWVVSVPVPLRYWMAASQDLTATVHTIIRTTIGQYYVNKAVARGLKRASLQPGSVTFMQRFGSALNVNLHFHCVFLEGVYLDRTDQGLKPRFVTAESPTDADIVTVVQTISRRVIRTLRRLGYLEAGTDDVVATGHDPLYERPNSPAPWRPPYSSAWPLASGCGALAQALAWTARCPRSPVPAVPACRAFPCTLIPRSRPIGALSWSA